MFATASRSRRNTLTNVVVRQSMRVWSGNCSSVSVEVFDILNVFQASGQNRLSEPLCRLTGESRQRTFQNVCTYYDVRIAVHFKW